MIITLILVVYKYSLLILLSVYGNKSSIYEKKQISASIFIIFNDETS